MDLNTRFKDHKAIWENNAKKNASWAVLSDPNSFDMENSDFFASGSCHIDLLMNEIKELNLDNLKREKAMDFGCGIGRLTRALSLHYQKIIGVDVSQTMIDKAMVANKDYPRCRFVCNNESDLQKFSSEKLDLFLSLIVFQHIPPPYNETYFLSALDLLKPGAIAIIQAVSKRKKGLKNRLRSALPEKFFRLKHQLLKSHIPYVTMYSLEFERVLALIEKSGATLIKANEDGAGGADWQSYTYFIRKNQLSK